MKDEIAIEQARLLREHRPELVAIALLLNTVGGHVDVEAHSGSMATLWHCIEARLREIKGTAAQLVAAAEAVGRMHETVRLLAVDEQIEEMIRQGHAGFDPEGSRGRNDPEGSRGK